MSLSSTFRRVWSQQDLLVTEVDAVLGQQTRRRVGLLWSIASGVQHPKGEVAQLFAGLFPPPPRRAQVPASANASSQTLPPPSPTTLPRTRGTVSVPEDAAVVLANAAAALIPVVASVVRDALGAPHMWCSRRHPYNAVLANAARKRCHPRSPTTPRTAVLSNPSATATSGSQLCPLPHVRTHTARSNANAAERIERKRCHHPAPRPRLYAQPPLDLAPRTHNRRHAASCVSALYPPNRTIVPALFGYKTAEAHLPRPTPYPIAPPAAPRPCTHAHRRRRIHTPPPASAFALPATPRPCTHAHRRRRVRTPPPRPRLHPQPPLGLAHTRTAVAAYAHHPRVRVCTPSHPSSLHTRVPPSPRTHTTPASAFAPPAAPRPCTHKTRANAPHQTYPKSRPLRDSAPENQPLRAAPALGVPMLTRTNAARNKCCTSPRRCRPRSLTSPYPNPNPSSLKSPPGLSAIRASNPNPNPCAQRTRSRLACRTPTAASHEQLPTTSTPPTSREPRTRSRAARRRRLARTPLPPPRLARRCPRTPLPPPRLARRCPRTPLPSHARTHAAPRVRAKQTPPPSPTLLHVLPTISTPPTSREPRTRMRAARRRRLAHTLSPPPPHPHEPRTASHTRAHHLHTPNEPQTVDSHARRTPPPHRTHALPTTSTPPTSRMPRTRLRATHPHRSQRAPTPPSPRTHIRRRLRTPNEPHAAHSTARHTPTSVSTRTHAAFPPHAHTPPPPHPQRATSHALNRAPRRF
ncbi:hypothetical protein B0H16DRAFT_1762557 [Mycena metata]|uniref:Uncharacterized protein n=1 Tax=Mycena metata TaxID=1033252 RepID=A0AAD7MY40_9AGAR|nr:hypothetical protein B0H16DRAFT_1762557 [Mycena metata]